MKNALTILAVVALSAGLADCGGGASSPAALPVVTSNAPVTQSISVPQAYVALGDSITQGITLAFVTQAYPYLVSPGVTDLGITGETAVAALTDELPKIGSPTVLTMFFGTNDVRQIALGTETMTQFASALQQLTSFKAHIVILNIPNYAPGTLFSAPAVALIPSANAVIASLGLPVVDLYDDAAYTALLGSESLDGVHPGVQGQAEIARSVRAVF